jgi:hypothetical protein
MLIKHRKIYTVNPDCTREELNELVEINNKRVEGGEECTVCIGHTQDSDPDTLSIPVGHADNFIAEGDNLFADLEIDQEWEDHIEKYHYNKVSIEKWVDGVIHPICLLARNRPALELGLSKYQMPEREDENGKLSHETLYYKEQEVENMSPAEIQQLFVETLEHSEFYSKFCDLLENVIPKMQESVKHMEDTIAPLLVEEAEEPEHEDIKPELEGEAKEIETGGADDKEEKAEEVADKSLDAEEVPAAEKVEEKKEPEVEKNDMAGISANNGYIADLDNEKKKTKKYQCDLLKAEEEKNELAKKYQMEVRKNELNELSRVYQFDAANEVEIVSLMDDDQWGMHKKIIATRYQKLPVGRVVSVAAEAEDRDVRTPDKVQKAIRLATDKGISFKDALQQV